MGWSVLEPPREEDETEENVGVAKAEQTSKVNDGVQIKVEEVVPSIAPSAVDIGEPNKAEEVSVGLEDAPAKAEVASLHTEESGVKVEKNDTVEDTPAEQRYVH
jgi:hypothetical protein